MLLMIQAQRREVVVEEEKKLKDLHTGGHHVAVLCALLVCLLR